MGMEPIWNEDGSLTVVTYTDAFTTHPVTGESFYRNIIHSNYIGYEKYAAGGNKAQDEARSHQKYKTGYTLGNGVVLTRDESRELENLLDDLTISWPWKAGDIMLLDNLQVAHGRNPFKGTRETLVALMS
jgi:alpha-ketoglutarate-dependent taurine dioxygenase